MSDFINWSESPRGTTHKDTKSRFQWVKQDKKSLYYWVSDRWKHIGNCVLSPYDSDFIARPTKQKPVKLMCGSAYRFKVGGKMTNGIYCKKDNCFYVVRVNHHKDECSRIKLLAIKK
mgnify:FL=1